MPKMHIGFVTLGLPFSGDTIKNEGLGGSETALLCMAKAMSDRGHRVSVFCNASKEGVIDGVSYYHYSRFSKISIVTTFDALIVSRWAEFLTSANFSGLRVLWLHDTMTDRNRVMGNVWQTDLIMALSDYHIANYIDGEDACGELAPFFWKTSNGVDMRLIKENLREKVPNKIIYTSRPERGLHFLLGKIFPALLENNPDTKLYFANYDISQLQLPDNVKNAINKSMELAAQYPNNVFNLGHLSKDRLYQEISSSQLLLYPTPFPEISCITAMEAQACGTPIVTTNDFALKETVDPSAGILVDGLPTDDEYVKAFCKQAIRLLNDPSHYKTFSKAGPKAIRKNGYTWAQVAENWEMKFLELMENRYEDSCESVITELARHDDLAAAEKLALEEGLKDFAADCRDQIDEAREYLPPTPENIVKDLQAMVPRFKKICELVASYGKIPHTVVDFAAGDAAFGLLYARAFPTAKVTLIDQEADVCSRLETYVEKSNFQDRVEVLEAPAYTQLEQPEMLFLGNYLDMVDEPWKALQVAVDHVKGGLLAFSVRTGAKTAVMSLGSANRVWNLSQQDFSEMLGEQVHALLSFMEEGVSGGGDLLGSWVGIIKVPEEGIKINKLSLDRRKRVVRPYPSLGCCMIAKNAEDWIVKCIKHVRDICDKIIVVIDSATTDNTEFLLKLYAPDVEIRYADFDNFSQMRNESRRDIGTDWVLWIDTDEMLVSGSKLRRYLYGPIMEGFALKQCHLMLDVHGTSDIPVRIFRNRDYYNWVGYVHEHCEDTSKGGFDNPIAPTVLLPDTKLAHYGYLNEHQRRVKCSNRNMELLRRDIEDNGKNGRKLSWLLALRDYLNIAKWAIERSGQQRIQKDSEEHRLVETAIQTYFEHLMDPSNKYHDMAEPMYQDALTMLGISGLCFEDRTSPPFCVALAMSGAVFGPPDENVRPEKKWFIDHTEFLDFMSKQNKNMLLHLNVVPPDEFEDDLTKILEIDYDYDPNSPDLLYLGANAIDLTTGRMR